MNICYLDAFSGISGDMTVGALIDAGAPAESVTGALDLLGTGAAFRVEKTKRKGIAASKFYVDAPVSKQHRHLSHILKMIEGAALSDGVKAKAAQVFQRLAEAEAKVHGTSVEKVHFHEVGAVDSICDIVGACIALDLLAIDELYCSPVNVGSGTANTEHGVLPVPTPATAELLVDRPVYSRGPSVELTTPTGAALATALASGFGAMPALTIRSSGFGAGDRDFPEHANVLRAVIGERSGAAERTTVAVLEANIDDMTPEVLGYAMERLAEAGALDASVQSILMKKSRPGWLLRVIAKPEDREALAALIFAETTTLGIRFHDSERRVQARTWSEVQTPHGAVRMKASDDGSFAPEYEDCKRIALAAGVPLKQVFAEANRSYLNNRK